MWRQNQFDILIDPGPDDATHLSNKSLFPTDNSLHTLQIKRRPHDIKNVNIGYCFLLDEDADLQLVYPSELTHEIFCENCNLRLNSPNGVGHHF